MGFKFAHVIKQIPVNSTPMKAQLQTMIDKGRLLTDGTVKSRTVVAFAVRAMHNDTHINGARDSAHDFIVKFSPSVCVV